MPNETIHNEIESWLAADVHSQLSNDERAAFQSHLNGCDACRTLHEEEKKMNELLESTLAKEAADPAFEQRMLSRFRDKVPASKRGLISFFTGLMRLRAAQITAVAALLLTLVQVGKMLTGEGGNLWTLNRMMAFAPSTRHEEIGRTVVTGSNIPTAQEAAPTSGLAARRGVSSKSNELRPDTSAMSADARDELKKDLDDKSKVAGMPLAASEMPEKESDQPEDTGALGGAKPATVPAAPPITPADNRKLIRNAQIDLQVANFDTAVQRLTAFATEENGFVATQNSAKLPNGKLQGTIVIKVLPENLDRFLQKARGLGELKNQTLGTDDVTKAYFDTDARLRNAKRMEDRLLEMLKQNTGKVSDLLQVEKELARVREQIEQMQGELKYYDALVQYATVTVTLAEKDLNEPAAFLLKETANLSLFSADVEKTFGEVKSALQNVKAQIVQSTLDRDNSGQATARMTLLIAPEESDAVITRIKGMGRVQNFNLQTDRVAQNGSGMSDTAKVERDKVQLNLVISRTGEEQAVQQTSLRIVTSAVTDKVAQLKTALTQAGGELRSSTFSRNPDGQEVANITLRVPMKSYAGLIASFDKLGEVKDLSVQRNDQPSTTANPETAPADVSLQIYSPGRIVSDESGIVATIRRTLGQGVAALAWSVRMIGVAIAFLAPWGLALALVGWLVVRVTRRHK
jgi:anti-sigma factor RsiW